MRRPVAFAGWFCGLAMSAFAGAGAEERFDIPAGDLPSALDLLARQGHVEFMSSAEDLKGLRTRGVHGNLTPDNALRELLKGTPLTVTRHPSGAILITRIRKSEGAPRQHKGPQPPLPDVQASDGEVVVTGTAQGLVATRTQTPLREIPQTISLITREQIDEQNDADLVDALAHAPGITAVRTDSLDQSFYSRGFKVTSYHVDGGAALFAVSGFQQVDTHTSLSGPFLGALDLSEFDRIEVLHGADALFASNGNPGATVSLVRKHPLARPQVDLNAWAGAESTFRAEADATGPIAFDGALRARVDLLYADHSSFYDTAMFQRKRGFAVFDYDLTPSSLLTVGGSYQSDYAVPFISGLPRYPDGSNPHLPRNTALTFDWSRYAANIGELYAQLRQQLGGSWKLALNASGWNGSLNYAFGTFASPINPSTGGLDASPVFYVAPEPNTQHQFTTDLTVTGSQDWLGHREELAIGADYTRASTRQVADYYAPNSALVSNVFEYDPAVYADPRTSLSPLLRFDIPAIERRAGLFSSIRVFLREDLSVLAGARFSGNRTDTHLTISLPGYSGSVSTHYASTSVITPFGGVLYDLSENLSVYASYADIYRSSAHAQDLSELKPSHGIDIETGIKLSSRDGALNGSVVFYRITQRDVPVADPALMPLGLYLANNTSRGIEAEISGHLQPDWLIAAGYSLNSNQGADGNPLSSATPHHLLKAWTSRQLPGNLHRWTLGGDIQAQSANSRSGLYCPDPTGFCPEDTAYRVQQRAYAVVGLRAGFQIDSHWRMAVSVNNVLDKIYYEAIASPQYGNWYGEPRNWLVRVDGRY